MAYDVEYMKDEMLDEEIDRQLRVLLSSCFVGEHNAMFAHQRFCREMPQHRWMVREPGRIIAHVASHERKIWSGDTMFAIGGIAEVCVHPDHRGKGLVKKMLMETHEWLRVRNVPFAVLFGAESVYSSSGYFVVHNVYTGDNSMETRQLSDHAMVAELLSVKWPEGDMDLRGWSF
jgi:predicted acetyltransferase